MKKRGSILVFLIALFLFASGCQRSLQLRVVGQVTLEGVGNPEGLGDNVTGKIAGAENLFVAKAGNPAESGNASKPGILVLSLQNPDSPRQIGYLNAPEGSVAISELRLSGTTLYALTLSSLWILDVSDPSAPKQESLMPANGVTSVAISGHFAYLMDSDGAITIVDIANSAKPAVVTTADLDLEYPGDLTAYGGTLLAVSASYLRIIDISQPLSPGVTSSFHNTGQAVNYGRILLPSDFNSAVLSGQYVYIAAGVDGMVVLDMSDPNTPRQVARAKLPQDMVAWRIFLFGRFACLVTGSPLPTGTYLELMDVSDPRHPKQVSSITLPSQGQDNSYSAFAEADSYLYAFANRAALGRPPSVVMISVNR